MKNVSLNGLINTIIFFYILSLYFFNDKEGMTIYSNALAFLLMVIIWMNFIIKKRKLILDKFLAVNLVFIAMCSISCFFAINNIIAINKVKTLILLFLLMVSLVNYIDSYEKIKKVIAYLIFSGFIVSAYILLKSDFSYSTRFGSEIGNVNNVGMIISLSAILCFYTIINEKKKFLYGLMFITMIITILLTGSRKAILFIFLNIILISYLRNKENLKGIIKFIFISVCILIITYYLIFNIEFFYEILGKRIEILISFISGEGTNEESMNMRFYMIKFGVEMFKENLFLGYGIDNYRVLLGASTGLETYAHNNYIELAVDIGIFGVCTYYLSHIMLLKDLFKASKKYFDKMICFTFISIIISYIILSSSLIYYDSKYFAILLILASITSRIGNKPIHSNLK